VEEIKSYILNFIWSGENISQFENWLYEQNSIVFEKFLGEENYLELISFSFKAKTIEEVKLQIKSILPDKLIREFEIEFRKRNKAIKGVCIKNCSLDYYGDKKRKWNVEIGKEYEFIIINIGLKNYNHSSLVNYIDKEYDFNPSGFIPMELFKINLDEIPKQYYSKKNEHKEITIEPIDWSKKQYTPTQYSFWEDFYNGDQKAINTYYKTIEKLGVKNVW
jgi:hypothetical protein